MDCGADSIGSGDIHCKSHVLERKADLLSSKPGFEY